jgi:hypothetical protein
VNEPTLRARVSAGIGRADLLHLQDRLDVLATAVEEERSFLPALTAQVGGLEEAVLSVLQRDLEEER